jgi:hypothetical protein
MVFRLVVLLLPAAGANMTLAEAKSRHWQSGKVTRVERPGQGSQPGRGTIGPQVTGGEPVIVPQPSSFAAVWALVVELPEASYVVTLPPPPRKSSLAKLAPGSQLECAVEGKTVYLKDQKGTVFRARIRERSAP